MLRLQLYYYYVSVYNATLVSLGRWNAGRTCACIGHLMSSEADMARNEGGDHVFYHVPYRVGIGIYLLCYHLSMYVCLPGTYLNSQYYRLLLVLFCWTVLASIANSCTPCYQESR